MLKPWFVACICLALAAVALAEDEESNGSTRFGLSWGFTRTYWSSNINDEGYARAGSGAMRIGIRRVQSSRERMEIVPHAEYLWAGSTVTTLICDTCYGMTITERSYFRELDLGFDVHYYPWQACRNFYVGAGPLVRWGSAGIRELRETRPGEVMKAAWFGINLKLGLSTTDRNGMSAFCEPVITWSPDAADRWQRVYPPDNLSLQMGLMWK